MTQRRIDIIDMVFRDDLDFLADNPDAEWDEAFQCFWITEDTPTDTWLKILNL